MAGSRGDIPERGVRRRDAIHREPMRTKGAPRLLKAERTRWASQMARERSRSWQDILAGAGRSHRREVSLDVDRHVTADQAVCVCVG